LIEERDGQIQSCTNTLYSTQKLSQEYSTKQKETRQCKAQSQMRFLKWYPHGDNPSFINTNFQKVSFFSVFLVRLWRNYF